MVALLLFLLHSYDSWASVAEKVSKSILYVESQEGGCTGFVVNADVKGGKDYIQTAGHCLGADLFADGAAAKVVWKDSKHDLAILEVEDTGRPALHLAAKNPNIGEEVASYGYGYALARPMFRAAHISDNQAEVPEVEGGPFVMLDTPFVPGQSGGPCVNLQGEVVLIVQRGDVSHLGIGAGAERLRDKAGRYYEQVK